MNKPKILIIGIVASTMTLWSVLSITSAQADPPTTVLVTNTVSVDTSTFNQVTVSCPSGMVVTGGGVDISVTDPGNTGVNLTERYSGPVYAGTGWTLGMDNHGTSEKSFTVMAVCVTGTASVE